MKLFFIVVTLLFATCATPAPRTFSPDIELLETVAKTDPVAAASASLGQLRQCSAAVQERDNLIAALREQLDECRAARIESERTAGKWDGLRAGSAVALGCIVTIVLLLLGLWVRRKLSLV